MWGRDGVEGTGLGVKEGELKPVCHKHKLDLPTADNFPLIGI